MGRKKRKGPQLKPFCYYCEREFDDEKVLIQHQKAKHFKCSECNRKLDTATGLIVHMLQVHKETISRVPNANTGRDNPELIIHGMAGVPVELIAEKQSKLDAERGAVKQQKTAHTVFGMSVMSGFFNQMNAAGMPGFMPGSVAGAGMANPMFINQFMAQFAAAMPQAAAAGVGATPFATAPAAPGVGPNGVGAGVPPASAFQGASGNASQDNTSEQAQMATTTGFAAGWSVKPAAAPAITLTSRLDVNLTPTLGLDRTAKLIFDVQDDQISPEELLAEFYGWKPEGASVAAH